MISIALFALVPNWSIATHSLPTLSSCRVAPASHHNSFVALSPALAFAPAIMLDADSCSTLQEISADSLRMLYSTLMSVAHFIDVMLFAFFIPWNLPW